MLNSEFCVHVVPTQHLTTNLGEASVRPDGEMMSWDAWVDVQGDISHQLRKPGGIWMTTVKASLRKGAPLLLQAPTPISITQGPRGAYT